jgi:mono/diheme cytochrome c family protein/rhodanese-related sulfurtransferase
MEKTLISNIYFGDMSSLQVVAIKDTIDDRSAPNYIQQYLANKQGVRLFSLSSSSVDSTRATLISEGFNVDSVLTYRSSASEPSGWSRDDGGAQRRSLDFDRDNPPKYLPGFVEKIDYGYDKINREWNTYYVYRRMYGTQPNGVIGISAIKIIVEELDQVLSEYERMGFDILDRSEQSARIRVFRHQEIHLHQSGSDEYFNESNRENETGVFALQFDVVNLDSTYNFYKTQLPQEALLKSADQLSILPKFAFGVRLDFRNEPTEQKNLYLTLAPTEELDSLAVNHAAALYSKYCELCHGKEREGYAADNAPSLRSHSLLASSKDTNFMRYTIQFGRAGTAMGGYLENQGGPMEYIEIELLLKWLYEQAGVDEPLKLSREPVVGDIAKGASLYQENCAVCHGDKGQGVSAPALANPMLLATATDHFLRYAITEGRDGTPMLGFKDSLDSLQINSLTAFLRSRASGWDVPEPSTVTVPQPEEYVLNAENEAPVFTLREGKFVSSEQVNRALQEKKRMIILDARSEVAWRQMHIPGAIPVPYYEDPDNFINDIPNDGTQIVIYCACPHAASLRVMNTLRRHGFEKTAIIDEGILVWAQMGLPVRNGQ